MALSFCDILSITDVSLLLLPYIRICDLFVLRCVCRELKAIVDSCMLPSIQRLVVNRPSSHFPEILLQNLHRLRVLHLHSVIPISDVQLHELLDNNSQSLRVVQLTKLNGYPALSAACIQPILLDQCHKLHTLCISGCLWLSDGALECFLLHLNRNINPRGHQLRALDLSSCSQLSSRVLNLFFKSQCLHLTTLNLSNLPYSVQDETLRTISINTVGATIENLNIIQDKKVTGEGIDSLKSCPRLQTLLCRGLDINLVKSAVSSFPSPVFIDIRRQCLVAMEPGAY